MGGSQFDSIDLTNKNGEEKITFCVSIYTSFAYKKITGRNLVFVTNPEFIFSISLQPNGEDLRYFKL